MSDRYPWRIWSFLALTVMDDRYTTGQVKGGNTISRNEVGTLKKGLDIFHLVLHHPDITTQEIMEAMGLNQSTTYRLVSTLEQNQLIAKNGKNGYIVSDVLISKLQSQNRSQPDVSLLQVVPFMDRLSKETGETTYIGILHGVEVVISHAFPGKYVTRTHHDIGDRMPLHVDAIGKCLLALENPERQAWILNNMPLDQKTEYTITSQELFREELAHIKANGYSLDNEEGEYGVRCIGAPITQGGRVIAAIAISGPSARLSRDKDALHISLVKKCAEDISNLLGRV